MQNNARVAATAEQSGVKTPFPVLFIYQRIKKKKRQRQSFVIYRHATAAPVHSECTAQLMILRSKLIVYSIKKTQDLG